MNSVYWLSFLRNSLQICIVFPFHILKVNGEKELRILQKYNACKIFEKHGRILLVHCKLGEYNTKN